MVWPGGTQRGPVIGRSGFSFVKRKRPIYRIVFKHRLQILIIVIPLDLCFEGLTAVHYFHPSVLSKIKNKKEERKGTTERISQCSCLSCILLRWPAELYCCPPAGTVDCPAGSRGGDVWQPSLGPLPFNSAGPQLILVLPSDLLLTCYLLDPIPTQTGASAWPPQAGRALLLSVGFGHFPEISPEVADHSGPGIATLHSWAPASAPLVTAQPFPAFCRSHLDEYLGPECLVRLQEDLTWCVCSCWEEAEVRKRPSCGRRKTEGRRPNQNRLGWPLIYKWPVVIPSILSMN